MAAEAGPEQEFAPAKVNLTLHVTGRRPDGYHLLESLVVFAGVGDVVSLEGTAALTVSGPFAAMTGSGADNLVRRAAALFGTGVPSLHLQKNLPVAAGLGGGSADAAATLRLLSRVLGRHLPADHAIGLGADVPVCLNPVPQKMAGIGETVSPVAGLPDFWLVLANPGLAIGTASVFKALRHSGPAPTYQLSWQDFPEFAAFLQSQRNDLQEPALSLVPRIADVLAALRAQPGCALARMSGSGATCFGLFPTESAARQAAAVIQAGAPSWWVAAAPGLS